MVKNTRGILRVCCTVREGHKSAKRGVTNVANIQDSQERALCALYWEASGMVIGQRRKRRGYGDRSAEGSIVDMVIGQRRIDGSRRVRHRDCDCSTPH
eukprot:8637851-Pyramimonas_sp.AAC.1